ncbi:MAG TPA: transketolase C-terminal domain-containing protein, partial [Salinivirgaceae bacterium]|nr:transketolase C-terminal domain-containing protein [Salinivirgaceae bacterium]
TTHLCLEAARQLHESHKIDSEIIDLRSLNPLDYNTITRSIVKTNKVLIMHEDKVFGGVGGEISAYIAENLFNHLDAPIMRVGATFTPVGFNRILEKAILPDTEKIAKKIVELFNY